MSGLIVITPLYAGLLAGVLFVLSVHAIRQRRQSMVALGDGGVPLLKRAVRAHANFTEYVPFALLMLLMLELTQHPAGLLHVLGVALVIGRLFHAWGITRADENFRWRIVGMAMTFGVLAVAGLALIAYSTNLLLR